MRATGIVRRVDGLGRVVLPMELRRTMGISDGDPMEIFVDSANGTIVLKRYVPDGMVEAHAEALLRSIESNVEYLKNADSLKAKVDDIISDLKKSIAAPEA